MHIASQLFHSLAFNNYLFRTLPRRHNNYSPTIQKVYTFGHRGACSSSILEQKSKIDSSLLRPFRENFPAFESQHHLPLISRSLSIHLFIPAAAAAGPPNFLSFPAAAALSSRSTCQRREYPLRSPKPRREKRNDHLAGEKSPLP